MECLRLVLDAIIESYGLFAHNNVRDPPRPAELQGLSSPSVELHLRAVMFRFGMATTNSMDPGRIFASQYTIFAEVVRPAMKYRDE